MSEPPTLPSATPQRLFRCTPSLLAAFDCPRRYRLTYLDRPRPARGRPWAHNTLGAAVHLALARWWTLPRAGRTPDEGERLLERAWQPEGEPPAAAGFRDEAQSQRYRDVAARWVRDYLAAHADPEREPVGVERTVGAPAGTLSITGRVDRIDERGDEVVVVDYKTGRGGVDQEQARGSQALAIYVLATRRALRRPCRRVELHHVPTGEIAAFEHTEESLLRQLGRAEQTAADIVAATDTLESGADPDEVFPAVTGPVCSWCDFRAHCAPGRAASSELEPWAGLPTA